MTDPVDVIPESREVIEQRVRDLVEHVQLNLGIDFLTADAQVRVSEEVLVSIIEDLKSEFLYSSRHTYDVIGFIISSCLVKLKPTVIEFGSELPYSELTSGLVNVLDRPISVRDVGVDWKSLLVIFGDHHKSSCNTAALLVTGMMNAALYSSIGLSSFINDWLDVSLEEYPYLWGYVAIHLLHLYHLIVVQEIVPELSFDYDLSSFTEE